MRNGEAPAAIISTQPPGREGEWPILVSKTGYIRRAGRCLVMGTRVNNEPVVMVLLHANTTNERWLMPERSKSWLETRAA